jgi:uncharacterized RDD family membrane protein YckC
MLERKGFGIRLGAYLIDIVIVIVVMGIIGVIVGAGFAVRMGGMGGGAEGLTPEQLHAIMLAGIIGNLLALAYYSTDIFMAGTPGKKLLKLTIMSETGAPAPPAQLAMRFAIKYSSTIIGFLAAIPGLGFLSIIGGLAGLAVFIGCFMTLGVKRQALHDMIAKTAVFGPGVPGMVPGFQPVMPGQGMPPGGPGSMPPPQA